MPDKPLEHTQRAHSPLLATGFSERIEIERFLMCRRFPAACCGEIQPENIPGQGGFTLIETLLALSITVLLLGVVLSALRLGIRSWERGEGRAEAAAARRSAVSMLSRDIGSMYPYAVNDGSVKRVLFRGGQTSLGFVTAAASGADGGARWVYYSANDSGLRIRVKTVPSAEVEKDEGGRLVVFDPGVRGINFEYMSDGGWEKSWDADAKRGLPEAIRVRLSYGDGRRPFEAVIYSGTKDLSGHDLSPGLKGSRQ